MGMPGKAICDSSNSSIDRKSFRHQTYASRLSAGMSVASALISRTLNEIMSEPLPTEPFVLPSSILTLM